MRASKSVKKAFLEAYLQGDGNSRKIRNENATSTNKQDKNRRKNKGKTGAAPSSCK